MRSSHSFALRSAHTALLSPDPEIQKRLFKSRSRDHRKEQLQPFHSSSSSPSSFPFSSPSSSPSITSPSSPSLSPSTTTYHSSSSISSFSSLLSPPQLTIPLVSPIYSPSFSIFQETTQSKSISKSPTKTESPIVSISTTQSVLSTPISHYDNNFPPIHSLSSPSNTSTSSVSFSNMNYLYAATPQRIKTSNNNVLDTQLYDALWIRFNTKMHTTFFMPTIASSDSKSTHSSTSSTPTITTNAVVNSQFNENNTENMTNSLPTHAYLISNSTPSILHSNGTFNNDSSSASTTKDTFQLDHIQFSISNTSQENSNERTPYTESTIINSHNATTDSTFSRQYNLYYYFFYNHFSQTNVLCKEKTS